MRAGFRQLTFLWFIMLAGLLLRLSFAASQPTFPSFDGAGGGDTGWYLVNGYGFFSGQEHGWFHNIPFYISSIPTPPLYIIFAGIFQQVLGAQETVLAMRLVQCLASIATVYFAYRLSLLITGARRVATVAAALTAFHPGFIIEPAQIATETLYIFFLACGFWLYLEYVVCAFVRGDTYEISPKRGMALTAMAFALATLTRAVAILFPVVIVLHLLLLRRRRIVADWRRLILILILVYAAIVSSWTIYNAVLWGRFVVVSDQFLAAVWRGAETQDGSPARNDELLLQDKPAIKMDGCQADCKYQHPPELYVERIGAIVEADIAAFVTRRLGELSYALIQPHGTTNMGQVSIREKAGELISRDGSLARLLSIIQIEGFAIKATIWVFHLGAIVMGIAGMWLARERLEITFPLIGFVVYTIVAHFFLLALPRYLFPLEVVWLIFAGIGVVALYDRLRQQT